MSNHFKVNITWVKVGNTCGYAGIIRDHFGLFISNFAGLTEVNNMHLVFLMSVMSGITLCKKLKIKNIIFEANFPLVNLVDTGMNASTCAPSLFYFRRRIIEELDSFLHLFSVINEKVNAVAQALAYFGTVFKNYKEINLDQLPTYIQGLLNLNKVCFPYVYH
ncbi:hypothetical protein MA16_Dca017047 [Dendrobium catenatum]|uniref:RNase H type-1 domain-containing protein n=1 Tax=Dendrobium catenatum TaxID=906689 RepID=A0A2I0W5W9_9ASPA|nr:hypothetical protein MA16_Dca017047 [Dendrobium catenatum]